MKKLVPLLLTIPVLAFYISHFKLKMFLNPSSAFFRTLIFSYILWLTTTFMVIALAIKKKNNYVLPILLYSTLISTFLSFLLKISSYFSIIFSIFFAINFLIVFYRSEERLSLFTRFKPREIFMPLLKLSFLLFTLMLTTLNFFQARALVSHKKPLIEEATLLRLTRPFIPLINKQLTIRIEDAFNRRVGEKIGVKDREEAIRLILSEVLETMSEGEIRKRLGFRPDVIPVDKVKIYETGEIDVEPALVEAAPKIARQINKTIQKYIKWLPFVVLFITLAVLLPLTWLFDLLSYLLLPTLFLILFKFSLLKKKKVVEEVERVM